MSYLDYGLTIVILDTSRLCQLILRSILTCPITHVYSSFFVFDFVPDRSISIQLQNLRSEWNIVIFGMECLKTYSNTTLLLCLSFQKQPVFFGLSLPSLLFPAPLPLSALCRCGKASQLSDRRFGRLTDEQPCGHHMTWDEVTWEIATTKWWWRQSVTEEVFNIFSRGRWMKVSSNQSYCLRQSEDLQDDIFCCFMVLSPSCPCRQQDGSMNTYNITTPILKCLLIK